MPGVDDGDVGIDPMVGAVDGGDDRSAAADARDAGRDRLGGQLDDAVRDDRDDVRIGQQVERCEPSSLAAKPRNVRV